MAVPDEFALLSAIWIMASNDENALITYQGLHARLTLPPSYNVTALITRHPELFRKNMPPSILEQWKSDMLAGKRLPTFIREAAAQDRPRLIAALKSENGFRSQFRAAAAAPRSEVAVIEWGLNHIERLRKAAGEARDARSKVWQLWLPLASSLIGAVTSIAIALMKK